MTCRLLHDWPKWSAIQTGNALTDGKRVGDVAYQTRICKRCGKAKMRVVAS